MGIASDLKEKLGTAWHVGAQQFYDYLEALLTSALANIADLGGVLTATAAEIDRVADVSARLHAAGASLTLTQAAHDGKTILLNHAAGSQITLPSASGSGSRFRLVTSVRPTSNQHRIQVASGTDYMHGVALLSQDGGDTAVMFETSDSGVVATESDRIDLNGTTTGGYVGAEVEIEDIAVNVFKVRVLSKATGTEASPFSAAV